MRKNNPDLFTRVNNDQFETIKAYAYSLSYNRSWLKRVFSYVLTIPGLIIISSLLLLIALAIKLDSPGPVLFRHKRVGLDGKIFDIYKFRSMYHNADQVIHIAQIRAYAEGKLNEAEGVKLKDDPRITKVGRILRSTSLDELPQLFNVLKGDMVLVGPRPVPVYEVELYKLWHSERLSTLPGITGLWQISGRSYVSFDEQLRLDIRYIRTQSIWLDIKILLNTVPIVISRRGAL
jgi:lipopolysaccharide/colanic/teichoic acid biosynthesis glycosyltransferase